MMMPTPVGQPVPMSAPMSMPASTTVPMSVPQVAVSQNVVVNVPVPAPMPVPAPVDPTVMAPQPVQQSAQIVAPALILPAGTKITKQEKDEIKGELPDGKKFKLEGIKVSAVQVLIQR